ncbi:MAG: hypothetical protein IKC51_04605 [Myxococcaceae bacterium]|nr:hypothetical protein [Myxococcaceae bacterium]
MMIFVVIGVLLNTTPVEIERLMDEADQIDCKKLVELMEKKCFSQCSQVKDEEHAKQCWQTCNSTKEGFSTSCKSAQDVVRNVKKMPKEKREKLIEEAAREESKRHTH